MKPLHFKTISEFLSFRHLPKAEHPLICVFNLGSLGQQDWSLAEPVNLVLDFYSISLKQNFPAKVKYGQQVYDFDEGVMSFVAPGQVFGVEPFPVASHPSGWMLLVHPDFFWNTPLAQSIKTYQYFDYSVAEALFLSEKEEATVTAIIENIEHEYRANLDTFSQDILIAQIELLLNYSQRFFHRQFLTREITNHRILERLEAWITAALDGDEGTNHGLPTVQAAARSLNISPHYLSEVVKLLTGQSTQQHIHGKLIEKAKRELSTTDLTVSQIAFQLGFEYPQSFSKLFKKKTNISPLDFRRSVSS